MGKRKTPEERAAEERRYTLAREAETAEDFEALAADSNQGIRAVAAGNVNADAVALARFAKDPFWGTRLEVVHHPNTTHEILLSMLESDPRKQGVVDHAARKRLIALGVEFDNNRPM